MKLMVLGAFGNLGSELVRRSPFEVVPIGRAEWQHIEDKTFNGVDTIIHTASELLLPISSAPIEVLDSNLMLTARLLERMARCRTPKLIFVSSCAVYGESIGTREDIVCHPLSTNGVIKLLNEQVIASYCEVHNITYQICRVFNMYGGRDRFSIISKLINAATLGTPLTINNEGVAQRDFIHVQDVADILLTLAKLPVKHRYVNVGTGNAVRISDLVEIIQCMKTGPLDIHRMTMVSEVEYSRANITLLMECIGPKQFISVIDYLKQCISQ